MAEQDKSSIIEIRFPKAIYEKYQPFIDELRAVSRQLTDSGTLSDLNWLIEITAFYLSLPRPVLVADYEAGQPTGMVQ